VEISAKEARARLSDLLKKAEKGEEVLLVKRGRKIARLIPFKNVQKRLPSLKEFRNSIRVKGQPLSVTVIKDRGDERY
jgi:prevent-host-death family protein